MAKPLLEGRSAKNGMHGEAFAGVIGNKFNGPSRWPRRRMSERATAGRRRL
jgi:hypothetical protein